MTEENKKIICRPVFHRREGVAGRVPLPGASLANHTFDGFGSKCFVPIPDEALVESEDMKEFFPDEPEEDPEKEGEDNE